MIIYFSLMIQRNFHGVLQLTLIISNPTLLKLLVLTKDIYILECTNKRAKLHSSALSIFRHMNVYCIMPAVNFA